MRILVAGATGVIGRRLIPLLVASNHEVIGTTRTADKSERLKALGATPLVVDVFDRAQLVSMVREAHPDVVIQQLTDLRAGNRAANARLWKEGTRNLVDAAHAAGVRQFITQSIAWVSVPGAGLADELEPLDLEAPEEPRHTTVEAAYALERAVAEMERGVVLRYGTLYGLGTWYAPDGPIAQQVRQGQMTADEGVTSFLHVEDAARAVVLALDWPPGIVNIVDDEPAKGTAASSSAPRACGGAGFFFLFGLVGSCWGASPHQPPAWWRRSQRSAVRADQPLRFARAFTNSGVIVTASMASPSWRSRSATRASACSSSGVHSTGRSPSRPLCR